MPIPHNDSSQAALLDFHSDRAVAHASFFLASIFGLFSVLALAQNSLYNFLDPASVDNRILALPPLEIPFWALWAIPYWALFIVGMYSFANFSLYATFAHDIEQKIRNYEPLPEPETTMIAIFSEVKRRIRKIRLRDHNLLTPFMAILYFIITLFASLLIFGEAITSIFILPIGAAITIIISIYYTKKRGIDERIKKVICDCKQK